MSVVLEKLEYVESKIQQNALSVLFYELITFFKLDMVLCQIFLLPEDFYTYNEIF